MEKHNGQLVSDHHGCTPGQPPRVLRPAEAARYIGVGLTSLWALSQEDSFPKPVPLTARARGYLRDELDAWLVARRVSAQTSSAPETKPARARDA